MAIISPNTFDPIRRYVSVRLAQGVPLADADWNEGDDMRRYELRAFLRWFVGDGVPVGNDGFRIAAINSATSFTIVAGGGKTVFEGLPVRFHAARWRLGAQHQMVEIGKPVFRDAALRFQRETIPLALPLRDQGPERLNGRIAA